MTNILQKFTSRKFLATVGGVVTTLVAAFGSGELTAEQVEALQTMVALLGAYILGEGYADGHSPTNKADEAIAPTAKEEGTYG